MFFTLCFCRPKTAVQRRNLDPQGNSHKSAETRLRFGNEIPAFLFVVFVFPTLHAASCGMHMVLGTSGKLRRPTVSQNRSCFAPSRRQIKVTGAGQLFQLLSPIVPCSQVVTGEHPATVSLQNGSLCYTEYNPIPGRRYPGGRKFPLLRAPLSLSSPVFPKQVNHCPSISSP